MRTPAVLTSALVLVAALVGCADDDAEPVATTIPGDLATAPASSVPATPAAGAPEEGSGRAVVVELTDPDTGDVDVLTFDQASGTLTCAVERGEDGSVVLAEATAELGDEVLVDWVGEGSTTWRVAVTPAEGPLLESSAALGGTIDVEVEGTDARVTTELRPLADPDAEPVQATIAVDC